MQGHLAPGLLVLKGPAVLVVMSRNHTSPDLGDIGPAELGEFLQPVSMVQAQQWQPEEWRPG